MTNAVGAVVVAGVVGVIWGASRPDVVAIVAGPFVPATATATPAPPTPTTPVLAGRTIAQARGRFTSLAAPPNIAGDRAPTASAVVGVLDDVGDIVTVALNSLDVTRNSVPFPRGAVPSPTAFVARGFFAAGGALVRRDDGTMVFDPQGRLLLVPTGEQPTRLLSVRSQAMWVTPVAAVVYGPSLYVFDVGPPPSGQPPSGRVWRHALTAGGNYEADAVAWLVPGQQVDLSLASDVATDGAFWVSRRDGTILRMAAGRAAVLDLKGAPLPTRLGAIYTDQGTQSIYVLDEGSRRLLRIGKDGVIGGGVDTVLAPGEAARGLWVDEDADTAVVVTTARIVVVALPR
jgi:hypothetical protein